MKKTISLLAAIATLTMNLLGASPALAATPYLSVSGSGDNISLSVNNADSNYSVELKYVNPGTNLPTTITNPAWYTNNNGSFYTTISANSYGIYSGANLYVVINNQQSSWQTYNGSGNGNAGYLYFSPSSVNLNSGQSAYVTATYGNNNGYINNLYLNSNSNSNIATATISGSSITIYGNANGSTTMNFCNFNNSQCANLYVTVSGNSSGTLTFSENNPYLNQGQSKTLSIYNNGYSGSYYISANTNSGIVNASISGSSLNVYGQSQGSSTITVCQNNYNYCGSLYVTVSGSGNNNSIWFNPSSPTLAVGQSMAVAINSNLYGNSYYISANTNSGAISATISGSTLNVYASQTGTSNITVCSSGLNACGTIVVSTYGTGNNGISFSVNNPQIPIGQSLAVTVYQSSQYNYYTGNLYILNNSNSNSVTSTLNGQTLTLRANNSGTSNITVCQSNISACGTLTITATGNVLGTSSYGNGQLLSQNGTVYLVYKNVASGFGNASAFHDLGFKFENVLSVSSLNIPVSSFVITNAAAAHPWGSWIRSGQTVYFVHENGLIPVPDWNTFLNNSGPANGLVNANSWDFQRQILSPMSTNDARLR